MNRYKFPLLVATVMILLPPALPQQIDYKGFPEWSWQKEGATEYMLYTPAGAEPGNPCPLAVFLHGCCGEDEQATLRNAVDPPARMWHQFGRNLQSEPTYIMTPKTTRGWTQKFPDIKNAIDRMVGEGKVDPQRIYMTGFSMGGGGTWQFMEKYPGYLAAAIPMGMGVRADLDSAQYTPIWAIRGEEDWHARNLPVQVDSMRRLLGYTGGAEEWVTGVNPRYTSFEGVGHGVQWDAASRLPLTEWAYGKINDGNLYPVVYFVTPGHRTLYPACDSVEVEIAASDPDGSVREVELRLNSTPVIRLTEPPFRTRLQPGPGDQWLEAVAYDLEGKSSTASILLQVDVEPGITAAALPEARAGTWYEFTLPGEGNDPLLFTLEEGSEWPPGIRMDRDGLIQGMCTEPGHYPVEITLSDAGGGSSSRRFDLTVLEKEEGVVLVREIDYPHDSLMAEAFVMREGALPNLGAGTEVTVSQPGRYGGLTCIATDQKAAGLGQEELLSFTVDEEVTVYVAYETKDRLYRSTIPGWLKDFRKEEGGQIVAQYFYFDVYSKPFPAGRITLPGAEAGEHNATRNYFVMVEKL
jgi:dienelactone hydrolase